VPHVVVHPTCSTSANGSTESLLSLARLVSGEVTVPIAWGCCAMAGDRGLLHPELTAAATAGEATEVIALSGSVEAVHVSANRTCEIAMTKATGREYRHVLEMAAEATRP
jgi:D-lactate dehydrogenase